MVSSTIAVGKAPRILVVFLIFFVVCRTASAGGIDFATLRVSVPDIWLENVSVPVRYRVGVYSHHIGVSTTVVLSVEVSGPVSWAGSYEVLSFRPGEVRIPPLPRGYYEVRVSAEGLSYMFRMVIAPPPVPYESAFSPDGSTYVFRSKKLVMNGTKPDPRFPFTLYFTVYVPGSGEFLAMVKENVTELEMEIPEEWKRGIVMVDVVDVYGWRNSKGMDLSKGILGSGPDAYDYLALREPPRAWARPEVLLAAAVAFVGGVFLIWRFLRPPRFELEELYEEAEEVA